MLSTLWAAIAAGDPLRAELETSTSLAIPHVAGQRDPAETESFVSSVLVNEAVRRQTPEGAAMLRTLMSLGTPAIRKTASRALGELTGAGIYPPEWVTEIGKVTPGQAWRRYDIFGDDEPIAATRTRTLRPVDLCKTTKEDAPDEPKVIARRNGRRTPSGQRHAREWWATGP